MGVIAEQVAAAQAGTNNRIITRMPSGWVVVGESLFLPGYCLLLADPVVPTLNDMSHEVRTQFLSDMTTLGDALLKVTSAARINYEILGNVVTELHAHLFPRYNDEPESLRLKPAWFYDWDKAPKYNESQHGALYSALREALS